MSKFGIGCGVVVMVWWLLVVGHASFVYQQLISLEQRRGYNNVCGIDRPPYSNRTAFGSPRNFPFVTTDSRADIIYYYYYRSEPRRIDFKSSYDSDWYRSVVVFDIPKETDPQSLPCATGSLEIYDYGFFRIVALYYLPVNWDPAR